MKLERPQKVERAQQKVERAQQKVDRGQQKVALASKVNDLKVTQRKIDGGRRIAQYVITLCRLAPHHAVLDVGCGGGGPALALTRYLSDQGRYEGLDLNPKSIARAQEAITSRFPTFHFQVIDVINDHYNPNGAQTAAEYRFPFDDATFDAVFLSSVFTHMLPADLAHYLREVGRVLKPGGRCLISYFFINPEAERGISEGRSGKTFAHHLAGCRADDPDVPERAVAYDEPWVRELYAACGLRVVEPVRYGSWSGRAECMAHQDFVVAEKPAS